MAKKKFNLEDSYTKLAQKNGFRARSYYKLEEIDQKYNIFLKNKKYLDLGAAPGAWTQYIIKKTNSKCWIDAVDLKEIKPFAKVNNYNNYEISSFNSNISKINHRNEVKGLNRKSGSNTAKEKIFLAYGVARFSCNVFNLDEKKMNKPYYAVISDMAPITTGTPNADSYESYLLVLQAAEVALKLLEPMGYFIAKYFEGFEMQELRKQLQKNFFKVKAIKPKATRSNSREVYILGKKK